jgi:hypothetical protein
MGTYTFKKVEQFDVTQPTTIMNSKTSSVKYGTIKPTGETISFGNQTWSVYKCRQILSQSQRIYIGEEPYDSYEVRNDFDIFVNARHSLLIANGSTKVVQGFLKRMDNLLDTVDLKPILFDFDKITYQLSTVSQAWFSSDVAGVQTMAYMGLGVKDNEDVKNSIRDHKVSYLNVHIDVNAKVRVMGFSRKGAIILVNANDPDLDETGKIDLVYTTYLHVTGALLTR